MHMYNIFFIEPTMRIYNKKRDGKDIHNTSLKEERNSKVGGVQSNIQDERKTIQKKTETTKGQNDLAFLLHPK